MDHNKVRHEVAEMMNTIVAEDRKFDLIYVDYRDELNDDQIVEYIEEGFIDSIHEDEWIWESRMDGVEYAMNDLLSDIRDDDGETLTDRDLMEIDPTLFDELRYLIEERDTSDPVADLVRNTGSRLFRVNLNVELDTRHILDAFDDDRPALVVAALSDAGIPDTEANRAAVMSLAAEQYYYGGALVAGIYMDIEDARKLAANGGTLVNPNIFVHDSMNGAAYEESFEGEIAVAPGNVVLDSRGFGYGLDAICGLVMSPFRTEVRVA